jgi:hypothetical protein
MIEILFKFFATSSSSQFNTYKKFAFLSFFPFLGVNHFLFIICLCFHRMRKTHTISPVHSMTFLTEKLCSLISDTTSCFHLFTAWECADSFSHGFPLSGGLNTQLNELCVHFKILSSFSSCVAPLSFFFLLGAVCVCALARR